MFAGKGMDCLKRIRQRNLFFAGATGFGALLSILVYVSGRLMPEIQTLIALAVCLVASAFLAALWLKEYKKLKIAQLIVENQILHVCPVVGNGAGKAAEQKDIKNPALFVSYFGMLLDTEVIEFSYNGKQLRAVKFGPDFISITYGAVKQVQTVRLPWTTVSPEEFETIIKKIHCETGIKPAILD
ncbi:MAG: hypothetical protein GX295_11165 [Syntrophomonadaceae bacterium]|nr:hypothetical protein [Syntrophomonadaceae bacterium]